MDNLLKSLKTAIFKVMEQMFFILPDEEEPPSPDNGRAIYIGISGTPGYLVTLKVDEVLASGMTTVLLGIEEEDLEDTLVRQSLRETANIVAGNFLLSFENDEQRNVTLPFNSREDVFPGGRATESGAIHMSFDGHPFSAILEVIETT